MAENRQNQGDDVEQMVQAAVAKAFEELSKNIADLPNKIKDYAASDEAMESAGKAMKQPTGVAFEPPPHGRYVGGGAPAGAKKPKVIRVPAGTLSKEGGHVYQVSGGQGPGKEEGSIPLLDDDTYLERAESAWQGGIVKVRGKNVSGQYQTMANLVQGSNFVRNFLSNNPQQPGKKFL